MFGNLSLQKVFLTLRRDPQNHLGAGRIIWEVRRRLEGTMRGRGLLDGFLCGGTSWQHAATDLQIWERAGQPSPQRFRPDYHNWVAAVSSLGGSQLPRPVLLISTSPTFTWTLVPGSEKQDRELNSLNFLVQGIAERSSAIQKLSLK